MAGRYRVKSDAQVLSAILRFVGTHGFPPTVQELRKDLGVRSTRTVLRYLRSLEKTGSIKRWAGARGMSVSSSNSGSGWEYVHEYQARLIRGDGFMCEAHPGLEFEHDPNCAGPGVPWIIEGRDAIEAMMGS